MRASVWVVIGTPTGRPAMPACPPSTTAAGSRSRAVQPVVHSSADLGDLAAANVVAIAY